MIKYNKKKRILSVDFNPSDNVYQLNEQLSKINKNIVIFKHEGGYRLIDNNGIFYELNRVIKIKL